MSADISEGELLRGAGDHKAYARLITKAVTGEEKDQPDDLTMALFSLEHRQPGFDGSYEMPIVYAAAHDASFVNDIPKGMRDDMCMLLTETLLNQALHHSPQASVEKQLLIWQRNKQVNAEFR